MAEGRRLTVDEHIAFLVCLRELAPKWKAVGDQLGVPVSELDAIHENNRGSLDMCGSCLRAMFLWWLRNEDATARKLARAVHEVGERSAEEKINREFDITLSTSSPGPLPAATPTSSLQHTVGTALPAPAPSMVSQPPTCPPLPATPTPFPVRTVGEPSCGVDVEIDKLDEKYVKLERRTLKTIKECKVDVDEVRDWVCFPPTRLRVQFADFLRSEAEQISSTKSVDGLFVLVATCWNLFHPDLLQYIVSKLGVHELQTQMEQYLEDLSHFRLRTTLGVFMDRWIGDVPPGYKEFVLELGEEWRRRTLEDLRQFQVRMSRLQCFGGGCVSVIKTTKSSSIFIVLALPPQHIPTNFRMKELHEFLRSEGVLKVVVDGVCVLDLVKLVQYERQLFELCYESDIDVDELSHLLSQPGLNPNIFDEDGKTPLWLVSYDGIVKCVKVLLQFEADANLPCSDYLGESPLITAASNGHTLTCQVLLKHGAHPDCRNKNGATPLFMASQEGHLDVVNLLISHGANLDECRETGATPLFIASQEGHLDIVNLLILHGANLDKCRKDGCTPLYTASARGHEAVVKSLLSKGANVDLPMEDAATPLFIASQQGLTKVVNLLISHGASLDKQHKDGRTPLFTASGNGHEAVVKSLLSKGANVDLPKEDGATPLFIASQEGHPKVVNLLISHGASLDKQHKTGATPLFVACQKGHLEVVKTLINHKANVNCQDEKGQTPLHAASAMDHPALVELLVKFGALLDIQTKRGATAVFFASFYGHKQAVGRLMKLGADLDIPNEDGLTPLIVATQKNHKDTVSLLLDGGAKPNITEKSSGRSPLFFASKEGNTEIAKLLLAGGADVKLRDKSGVTAYQVAKLNNKEAICTLLNNYYNTKSESEITEEQEKEVKRSDQRLQKIVDALEKLLLPGRAEKKRHMQHSQKEAETGSAYC